MRNRDIHTDQAGFTLVELLVTILIIALLAAIALPAFLSQRQKAHDGDAKHNVRALASLMAACYEEVDGYVGCSTSIPLMEAGLPIGAGPGQARVVMESGTEYTIEAVSEAETGGAHHRYTLQSGIGGANLRLCTPYGAGGCQAATADPLVGEW